MADESAPERPHQIADGERAERGKKLGDRVLVREELPPYRYK
jgi:hypothetical protein